MPDGSLDFLSLPIFAKNDVIEYESSHFRVIEVTHKEVFLFQLGLQKGFPMPIDYELLESKYMVGEFKILDSHDYWLPSTNFSVRDNAYDEAISRYEVIKPIVEANDYLLSCERGRLVKNQIQNTSYSKTSIYRLLRLYWSYGQCLQALATRYDNCGARGEVRTLTNKKPGKKSASGHKNEAIRTKYHLALMHRVIDVFHFAKKKDLRYTYRRFVTLCKKGVVSVSDNQIPSIESLRNVLNKHYSIEEYAEGIYDQRVYRKDVKGLKSTATASLYGPGDRYEIDATLLEVHVVANNDPSNVVGKPTIYLMVDVYARLITGYYVGLHSPSYKIATITLLSAVQDKSHLLKKYNISEKICSTWPAAGLPSALLSDKAELFGRNATHLAESTGIRMENTASGRSDAKGTIERTLGLIQRPFLGDMPGKSNNIKNKKAGAVDGRLTASLTLDELEEIIVSEIVLLNNCRVVQRYDRAKDMPDDMPLTPINIWNWGMINRTGKTLSVDEDSLRVAVLPRDEASVNRDGVFFKTLYYSSPQLEKLGWFIRLKGNRARPTKVKVLFDPLSVNRIYLILPGIDKSLVQCDLKPRSRAYLNCTFLEVEQRVVVQKQANSTAHYEEEMRKLEEKTLLTLSNAAKRKRNATVKKTAAQKKREIPANKADAKKVEQEKLIQDYSPKQQDLFDEPSTSLEERKDDFNDPELEALFNIDQDKEIKHEADGINDEH